MYLGLQFNGDAMYPLDLLFKRKVSVFLLISEVCYGTIAGTLELKYLAPM